MNRDDAFIAHFDSKPGTVYRVVDADRLEAAAAQGFTLAAVLQDEILMSAQDQEQHPITEPGYAYPNRTDTTVKTVHHVARRVRCLMRQDEQSALAAKQVELDQMQTRLLNAETARSTESNRAAKLESETKSLQAALADCREDCERQGSDLKALRESRRKLEGDLGKIRNAVGDLRMREILGT